jgi:ribosomal protein S18 acetylase RimI-like enzyme
VQSESDFRQLTPQDIDQAASVLAQAFIDDPLCRFMLPWRATRVKTLTKFFRAYGTLNIAAQRGYGAGEPLQGVAYWDPPSSENLSISVKSLGLFLPVLFTFYTIGYIRAKAIIQTMDEMHQKYASEPHYYLDNLGVIPSGRGKGIASRLIRPILEMADEQNILAYTDTVTPTNVALYEHFGFQSVAETPVPGTGITVWGLRRPAQ